jgi:hypothetical protein
MRVNVINVRAQQHQGDRLRLQRINAVVLVCMSIVVIYYFTWKRIQGRDRSDLTMSGGASQLYNQASVPVGFSHQIGAVDAHYDSFLSRFLIIEYRIRTSPVGATNPVQHFSWVKYDRARSWHILRWESPCWRCRQARVHIHRGEGG